MPASLPEDPAQTNQRAVAVIMTVVAAGFFICPPVSCASTILVTAFRSTCFSFAMGIVVAHNVTLRPYKQICLHWALLSNEVAFLLMSRMWCYSFVAWLGLAFFEHLFVVAFCFFVNAKLKFVSLASVHVLFTFLGGIGMYILEVAENGTLQVNQQLKERQAAWPAIAATVVGLLVGGMVYLHSSASHELQLTLQAAKEKIQKALGLDDLALDSNGVQSFGVVPSPVEVPAMQATKIQPPRQCPAEGAMDSETTPASILTKQDAARQDEDRTEEARNEDVTLPGVATDNDTLDVVGQDSKGAEYIKKNCFSGELVEPQEEQGHLLPKVLAALSDKSESRSFAQEDDPVPKETDTIDFLQKSSFVKDAGAPSSAKSVHDAATIPGAVTEKDALDASGKDGKGMEYMKETHSSAEAATPVEHLTEDLQRALADLRGEPKSKVVEQGGDAIPNELEPHAELLLEKSQRCQNGSGKQDGTASKKKQNTGGAQNNYLVNPCLGEALHVLRVGVKKAGARSKKKRLRPRRNAIISNLKRISEHPQASYRFAGTIQTELQMHLRGMTVIIYGDDRASQLRPGMESSGIKVASVLSWTERLMSLQLPEHIGQEFVIMDVNDDMEEFQLSSYLNVLEYSGVSMYCLLTEDYLYAVGTQDYLVAAGWEVVVATVSPRYDYYIGLMRKPPALVRTGAVRDLDDVLNDIDWDAVDPGTA
eukprot:TRINITY_DN50873_c0_g1_i1.p1 TRINITY_DN50873_c0_g1~~TRINITY_DN50873_c0_g1_i1.p1  ORF type:complete len:707 (+),score=102.87 TRINITY_DN50873_c0_g1_i1:91-2211(+)